MFWFKKIIPVHKQLHYGFGMSSQVMAEVLLFEVDFDDQVVAVGGL